MLILIAALVLTADPRFVGGAQPTPLGVPGPVDQNPSIQACTTQTLRLSSKCVFDAHPHQPVSENERQKQAKDNLELALTLGKGICRERAAPTDLDPKEKSRRASACVDNATRAAGACSLNGAETLLDAEGRFSTRARACYESLATALQSADVPLEQKTTAPPTNSNRQAAQPTKI